MLLTKGSVPVQKRFGLVVAASGQATRAAGRATRVTACEWPGGWVSATGLLVGGGGHGSGHGQRPPAPHQSALSYRNRHQPVGLVPKVDANDPLVPIDAATQGVGARFCC